MIKFLIVMLTLLLLTSCAGFAKGWNDYEAAYPSQYRHHAWSSYVDSAAADTHCETKAREKTSSVKYMVALKMDCMHELGWY